MEFMEHKGHQAGDAFIAETDNMAVPASLVDYSMVVSREKAERKELRGVKRPLGITYPTPMHCFGYALLWKWNSVASEVPYSSTRVNVVGHKRSFACRMLCNSFLWSCLDSKSLIHQFIMTLMCVDKKSSAAKCRSAV